MADDKQEFWRPTGEPDPVDIHVGRRIRMRRILLAKSQETVAEFLGISFQQLQKYESGANRVSASRLFDIAHCLDVPISYFFEDLPQEIAPRLDGPDLERIDDLLTNRSTLELVRDFHRIRSPLQQRCVIELIHAMAEPATGLSTERLDRAADAPSTQ